MQSISTYILIYILFIGQSLFAQVNSPLETILLKKTAKISADRYQNIYLINDKQDVIKYENSEQLYSSIKRTEITHIEAANSLKIFLFNKEYQEYTLLDKYLTHISTTPFNTDEIGFVNYATLAIDGNIWAIDNTDYSLKKVNIRNNKTMVETNLNFILNEVAFNNEDEILFMKESGNYLYICTKSNGILVFDNLGTYKKKLSFNAISFLGFKDNDLYFITGKELTYFNLLSLETKKELLPFSGSKALIVGNKIYIVE